MFTISDKIIDPLVETKKVYQEESGGFVSFEGWVRNHNEGHSVSSLEYQAYQKLAESEGNTIISEVKNLFSDVSVRCIHRVGHLQIGELAVWVGVGAGHRDAAFRACRYVIDEIKDRLPIWKKEHYIDGATHWINCQGSYQGFSSAKIEAKDLFQTQLEEADFSIQQLQDNQELRTLFIADSASQTNALTPLLQMGLRQIWLHNPKELEAMDLTQCLYFSWQDIGRRKDQLLAKRIQEILPQMKINTIDHKAEIATVLTEVDLAILPASLFHANSIDFRQVGLCMILPDEGRPEPVQLLGKATQEPVAIPKEDNESLASFYERVTKKALHLSSLFRSHSSVAESFQPSI
ncbi:MAG: molybdenum cofactor biosynthesis protein MoaE [Pseudobacteriovorax sp.]|nr:molybdenum cofactor biosynthesis protein MoaE [Pseudobacteriovorax sp.]